MGCVYAREANGRRILFSDRNSAFFEGLFKVFRSKFIFYIPI